MKSATILLAFLLVAVGVFAALIKCPECKAPVSDKAERCPRCGFPLAHARGVAQSNQVARVVAKTGLSAARGYILCVVQFGEEKEVQWLRLHRRVSYAVKGGLVKKGYRYEDVLRHPLDQTGRAIVEVVPGVYRVAVSADPDKRAPRSRTKLLRVPAGKVLTCTLAAR